MFGRDENSSRNAVCNARHPEAAGMIAQGGTGPTLKCSTLTPPLPHQRRTLPATKKKPQGNKLRDSIISAFKPV
jgi:hypothetical protein